MGNAIQGQAIPFQKKFQNGTVGICLSIMIALQKVANWHQELATFCRSITMDKCVPIVPFWNLFWNGIAWEKKRLMFSIKLFVILSLEYNYV
jgi:hypothetical protein